MADAQYKAETDEAMRRLDGCKKQKDEFDLDLREGLFFAAPHLARDVRSDNAPSQSKPTDAGERNSDFATELSRDFATAVVEAFMPQAEPWAERRPGMFLPDAVKDAAKKAAEAQDPVIFDAIRASNLYEELPKAFVPNLALGTAALWIDDLRPAENIVVQAIPIRELEINLGPFGDIDDRFVVRHTRYRHVPALLKGVALPEKIAKMVKEKPDERCVVRWGFWRDWERLDDVVWKHVKMVDKQVVDVRNLVGEGSCPLLPMRFNASADWAWAAGPLIDSLPTLRMHDTLIGDLMDFIETKLRPPIGYPDDTFAAVESGIETGAAYPIRPGSEKAVVPLIDVGDAQAALFETAQIEDRLRRAFFLNFPQQRGKTPPTATQWIDELQEAQRRLGTPGMSFWKEGPAQIFLRFKYLLESKGRIEPIKVNGKTVSLEPYNPAQRAVEQQEVAMFARYASIVAPLFPEEWRLKMDGGKTIEAVAEKMRVSALAKFRSPEDQQKALGMISKLIEGRQQVRPGDPATAGNL